eukprot:353839-Chlamydomonas_euryale.AAC.13
MQPRIGTQRPPVAGCGASSIGGSLAHRATCAPHRAAPSPSAEPRAGLRPQQQQLQQPVARLARGIAGTHASPPPPPPPQQQQWQVGSRAVLASFAGGLAAVGLMAGAAIGPPSAVASDGATAAAPPTPFLKSVGARCGSERGK